MVAFKTLLLAKFRPENPDLLAMDRLSTITQTSTVQDYVNRFMDITVYLPNITNVDLCDKFMRGIQSHQPRADLRDVLGSQRTLDNYYNMVLSWEGAREFGSSATRMVLSTNPAAEPSVVHDTAEPMVLDVIQGGPHGSPRRNGSGNYSNSKRGGGNSFKNNNCDYCSRSGHTKYKCFKRKDDIAALDEKNKRQGRGAMKLNTNVDGHQSNISFVLSEDNNVAVNKDTLHHYLPTVSNDNEKGIISQPTSPSSSTPYNIPFELVPVVEANSCYIETDLPHLVELNTTFSTDLAVI